MSRRMMLAGQNTAITIPEPLPGDGGGGDPDPGTGWPATDDTTLLAIRPSGRLVGAETVATSAERDAAAAALLDAVDTAGRGPFGYWDGVGPDYRTELFMQPGTYSGGGNSDWRAIVGTNPDTPTVIAARNNSGGVIHSFGSLYIENLRLVAQTTAENSAPKYPWHITGGEMCIAANCTFDLSEIEPDTIEGGSGIAGWVGADGDSGMTILLYGCDFIPGPLANTLNVHGPGGALLHPMTLILVNCTGLDGLEVYAPGEVADDGQPSTMYVINTPVAGIGAATGCHVYTDGDAPAMGINAATIHRDVTTWPIPAGGMSDFWADHYYPSAVGTTATITPDVTDAAPMAPVVGRTYYTRIRLSQAGRITRSGVTVTTAAGQLSQNHFPADTPYVVDEPLEPDPPTSDPVTAAVGEVVWQHYYAYTRYPGDNGFWHKVAFTDAAVRVTGSADLPGITDCYYSDDDVTLVPVSEGTPHPVPFLRAS